MSNLINLLILINTIYENISNVYMLIQLTSINLVIHSHPTIITTFATVATCKHSDR